MHWHAYQWTGAGADRANEAERRTTSADFPASPLPPMRTGDWLAKPPTRIAGTFTDVAPAVEWLEAKYDAARSALLTPERIPLSDRLANARDLLPRGVDVQWGEWLSGGRFITLGMVCCPNRHTPHSCPTSGRTG
ncbi:hypothetical protein HII36_05330 [Nonomuraea sp. NN258]|uniref:hypothetical protein n=1 Tax=Nonomuraea antri TaxID=2730852 RepID=UPI0015681C01|nr:hypothetical protein [Nonomuraea antri]NRQ31259.1 hypothetical protein [Nonomuraea antri]